MQKSDFDNDFWKSVESLKLYPEKSVEAETNDNPKQDTLAGAAQEMPPGGDNQSDASGNNNPLKTPNSNEQNNEINEDMTDDVNSDVMSDSGMSDASGTFDGGDQKTQVEIKPFENPFKAQNGKEMLDGMLQKLQSAVENTLSKVTANTNVDAVVVSKLEDLKDDIDCVLDTVYVLPKESTMYRYSMQVQTYKILCDMLSDEIKKSNV